MEYRLKRLEEQSAQILRSIDELKNSLPRMYVSKEICFSKMDDMERRISELEQSKSTAFWAILAGGGSLIVTLLRFVIGF